jgi:hypothetical protein
MRGIPVLMILVLAALSALMISVGWIKHDEAGYLPFILGIVWALFTLGTIVGRLRPDPR